MRDWAVWQARAGCYSQAAVSSNDSKTLYLTTLIPLIILPCTSGFVLAHAYYPYEFGSSGGDVHFDEDEAWDPSDQAAAR